MALYLLLDKYYVEMDNKNYEWMGNNLEYNPILQEGEIIGFCLRGDRIIPVVDLQKALNLKRAAKRIFIVYNDVALMFEYEEISSDPSGRERIELCKITENVKKSLGVEA